MANLWSGSSTGSPVVNYQVLSEVERHGLTLRIRFQVNARLGSRSYIGTGHYLDFYGGTYSGSTQAHVQMLDDNSRWDYGHDGWYATNWFDVNSTASSITLYFFIQGQGFTVNQDIYNLSGVSDAPAYIAPTAPTWVSISPNPCNINNKPTITWGGASAGSSGQLLYDIEVRSTKSSGGWTDWLRIKNSYSGTSYTEIVLSGMNVHGQKPYVGVKYQYRIRSYGNLAGDSDLSAWKTTSELTVSFTAPKAPTVKWNPTTVKKNKTTTLSWSGASGGSGSITNYKVVINLTEKNKTTILSTNTSTQSGTSMIVDVLKTFSTAKNGNYLKATVYTNNSWGQQSSGSTPVYALVKGNQIWIKIGGSWKEGECYVKINGSWKEGLPYIKVNGSWKESV